VVLKREQLSRLPGEQLVGEALECLAEHHPAPGARVTGAQVQVGQPALTPPVPPFNGEDHQVQGVPGLHLDPRRPAPPRRVRGVQRLDHDPLVPVRDRVREERRRPLRVAGHQAGHEQLSGGNASELGVPLGAGRVDQVPAIQVQDIKQEH
jgi:hypothetical protein